MVGFNVIPLIYQVLGDPVPKHDREKGVETLGEDEDGALANMLHTDRANKSYKSAL